MILVFFTQQQQKDLMGQLLMPRSASPKILVNNLDRTSVQFVELGPPCLKQNAKNLKVL